MGARLEHRFDSWVWESSVAWLMKVERVSGGHPCSLRVYNPVVQTRCAVCIQNKDVAWQCGKGTDFGMSDLRSDLSICF